MIVALFQIIFMSVPLYHFIKVRSLVLSFMKYNNTNTIPFFFFKETNFRTLKLSDGNDAIGLKREL